MVQKIRGTGYREIRIPGSNLGDHYPRTLNSSLGAFYFYALKSSPRRTSSVRDNSPMPLFRGKGSFLIRVGAAMICSPYPRSGLLINIDHLEIAAPLEVLSFSSIHVLHSLGTFPPFPPDGRTGGLKQNASFEGKPRRVKDIRKILDSKFKKLGNPASLAPCFPFPNQGLGRCLDKESTGLGSGRRMRTGE